EILQWATSEVLGLAHDTVMDFDLQMSVASQRAASTLMLPADPDSLLVGADAVPDALVTSSRHFENPSVGAGIASSYQGPRASFEIEWIEGAIPDHEVITVYGLFSNPGAERAGSILQIEGYPGEGDITQTFLDHPSLVAPLDTVPFAGAVIEWSGEGEPAESLRICGASRCFFALWPDETTEVRLPSLPVELFDDAEVTGWLYAEDGRLTDDSRDRRYAWRSMTFVP
ncbi:MAG: hypothetical protein JNK04_09680, partial [Myxococcales bacterium]|nr:hypothetical protein [Myxococcales bacterium]